MALCTPIGSLINSFDLRHLCRPSVIGPNKSLCYSYPAVYKYNFQSIAPQHIFNSSRLFLALHIQFASTSMTNLNYTSTSGLKSASEDIDQVSGP